MNNILLSSFNLEKINQYDSEASKASRLVGTGEIRLDKIMKPSGDGLYSMLFASTFHPEYIYACQLEKKIQDEDIEQILER